MKLFSLFDFVYKTIRLIVTEDNCSIESATPTVVHFVQEAFQLVFTYINKAEERTHSSSVRRTY